MCFYLKVCDFVAQENFKIVNFHHLSTAAAAAADFPSSYLEILEKNSS